MYRKIDKSKLPSRGLYYNVDFFIEIRPFSDFEKMSLLQMNSNSIIDTIRKLEFSTLSFKTNIDELSLCYTDVCYLYFLMYSMSYPEINVTFNDETLLCSINEDDFIYSNPNFNDIKNLYYDELELQLYHPSLYNIIKANENIINCAVDNPELRNDNGKIEKLSFIPYLQKDKISDNALPFINEHINTFSDLEISKMRTFLNSRENVVLGQKIKHKGEEKLINLSNLI